MTSCEDRQRCQSWLLVTGLVSAVAAAIGGAAALLVASAMGLSAEIERDLDNGECAATKIVAAQTV